MLDQPAGNVGGVVEPDLKAKQTFKSPELTALSVQLLAAAEHEPVRDIVAHPATGVIKKKNAKKNRTMCEPVSLYDMYSSTPSRRIIVWLESNKGTYIIFFI
jgi:hypothetical protein